MFAGLWANLKDDLLWVKKVAHDQPLDAMNKGTKVVTDTIKEPITIIPGYKKK